LQGWWGWTMSLRMGGWLGLAGLKLPLGLEGGGVVERRRIDMTVRLTLCAFVEEPTSTRGGLLSRYLPTLLNTKLTPCIRSSIVGLSLPNIVTQTCWTSPPFVL
jgi:hypothetical protein